MYFCDIEKRKQKEVLPGIRIRTFWQEKMLLSVVDIDAKVTVPRHQHTHEQCGTVISGQITLTIDKETRLLNPGDSYMIPGNMEHMAVASDTPVQLVEIFSPVREEYKY